MYNERLTEAEPIAASIATTGTTGSWYSDAIPLNGDQGKKFRFLLNVPTLSGGATVDFGVQTSATSGGAYVALAGASITQETVGNKTFNIELSAEQVVNAVPTALFMKGYVKVGTAAAAPSLVCYGSQPEEKPVTNGGALVQTANTIYA